MASKQERRSQYSGTLLTAHGVGGVLLTVGLLGGAAPSIVAEDCKQVHARFEQSDSSDWTPSEEDRLLSEAVRLCPRWAAALNDLGLVREKQGQLDEAEALYRRALAEEPEHPAPHAGLGDVRFARKDYAAAVNHYEAFLDHLQRTKQVSDPADLVHLARHEKAYRKKLLLARRRAGRAPTVIEAAEISRKLLTVAPSSRAFDPHYQGNAYIDIVINFDFDSARLSERSQAQMEEIAIALRSEALKHSRIRIEGHTDDTGSDAYNQNLSEHRARAVKDTLAMDHGVDGRRLETTGYGESLPFGPNTTEAGKEANRRVTFVNFGPMLSE